jgi:hypothetical protein
MKLESKFANSYNSIQMIGKTSSYEIIPDAKTKEESAKKQGKFF